MQWAGDKRYNLPIILTLHKCKVGQHFGILKKSNSENPAHAIIGAESLIAENFSLLTAFMVNRPQKCCTCKIVVKNWHIPDLDLFCRMEITSPLTTPAVTWKRTAINQRVDKRCCIWIFGILSNRYSCLINLSVVCFVSCCESCWYYPTKSLWGKSTPWLQSLEDNIST